LPVAMYAVRSWGSVPSANCRQAGHCRSAHSSMVTGAFDWPMTFADTRIPDEVGGGRAAFWEFAMKMIATTAITARAATIVS